MIALCFEEVKMSSALASFQITKQKKQMRADKKAPRKQSTIEMVEMPSQHTMLSSVTKQESAPATSHKTSHFDIKPGERFAIVVKRKRF